MRKVAEIFRFASGEEAEKVDYVVCALAMVPPVFDDDVIAACAICKASIRHRPNVPKRPPKICLGCATTVVDASAAVKQ